MKKMNLNNDRFSQFTRMLYLLSHKQDIFQLAAINNGMLFKCYFQSLCHTQLRIKKFKGRSDDEDVTIHSTQTTQRMKLKPREK